MSLLQSGKLAKLKQIFLTGKAKPPKGLEREDMDGYVWAMLAKPLVALVVIGGIATPIRVAVQKWMPDSKLKRFLLFSWRV